MHPPLFPGSPAKFTAQASAACALCWALAWAPLGAAWAEKADRTLPMVVESDGKQAASVDLARKVTVINGNVRVTQGTLLIRADRVEVREPQTGQYTAVALGQTGQRATFRQKRDRVDEFVEAEADRIEYDGASELVRCIGSAQLRVLRGGEVTDEANGATIVYNQHLDTVQFDGTKPTAPGEAGGKVRLVFTPRPSAPADAAASQPAPPNGGARP